MINAGKITITCTAIGTFFEERLNEIFFVYTSSEKILLISYEILQNIDLYLQKLSWRV